MDCDLYLMALRVLSRFTGAEPLEPRHVNELRRNSLPDEADLPLDDLCCRIIHRHLAAAQWPPTTNKEHQQTGVG
jgi:hypothetical protein